MTPLTCYTINLNNVTHCNNKVKARGSVSPISLLILTVPFNFLHSAGVGRTGTYIAIDSLMEQAKHEPEIDVFQFVIDMRQKRMKMIQTAVSVYKYANRSDVVTQMVIPRGRLGSRGPIDWII